MRYVLILLLLGQCFAGASQAIEKELPLDNFIDLVKTHHPVFYQASLIDDVARGNMLMARGGFDPKLDGGIDAKSFDEKNYYNVFSAGVKIPTWIGVDLKAGYDRSTGVFLDNSDNLPDAGLYYAGISVPIGKGLLIDERRATLKKARIFSKTSMLVQKQMKNELLYEAVSAYLDWQESFLKIEVAVEGVEIAERRFTAARSSFVNGDKPAIDTLESLISVQNRNIELAKAQQELVKAVFQLNNYLWLEGELPLELEENTVPENFNPYFSSQTDSLHLIEDQLILAHPELLSYEYKLDELAVDRSLAVESLKPDVRIDYNPLYESGEQLLPTRNFKYGISASYPLLIRKERGKLQITEAKIADTDYELEVKRNQIDNKLEMYYRLQEQINVQNDLIADAVDNYRRMVEAENRRFGIGESSIFLINTREVKYLESRGKLIEGRSNLLRTRLFYLLNTGQLFEVI